MKKIIRQCGCMLIAVLLLLLPLTACSGQKTSGTDQTAVSSYTDSKEVSWSDASDSGSAVSQSSAAVQSLAASGTDAQEEGVREDGEYTSKDEVALYIHLYGHLPSNYITKKEAEALGWSSKEGNLWDVAPGKSIGGSYFGNYEGLLPEGHTYRECDIDFDGGYRGAKRIIFSDDGLIFYTGDHYKTFEQLY